MARDCCAQSLSTDPDGRPLGRQGTSACSSWWRASLAEARRAARDHRPSPAARRRPASSADDASRRPGAPSRTISTTDARVGLRDREDFVIESSWLMRDRYRARGVGRARAARRRVLRVRARLFHHGSSSGVCCFQDRCRNLKRLGLLTDRVPCPRRARRARGFEDAPPDSTAPTDHARLPPAPFARRPRRRRDPRQKSRRRRAALRSPKGRRHAPPRGRRAPPSPSPRLPPLPRQ